LVKQTWEGCDHLARFEAVASVYYRRFGRLYPGKAEPMGFESSNSPENNAQVEAWHQTGLAFLDMSLEVARLQAKVEALERRLDDLVSDLDA